MGCHLSKCTNSPAAAADNNLPPTVELTSYESACRRDPDIQSFDTNLHQKMTRTLSTLANGVEVHSLSFDSLKEVIACLLDMNQDVAKVILDCKNDIWKTPELFQLVQLYLDNSLQTLDFCNALERCLNHIVQLALQLFPREAPNYETTLELLRRFKANGNPFTEEFFSEFRVVYEKQLLMLEELQVRKRKLDKKLKSVKAWRKVSCVIFAAVFASVIICSVVAAAVAAPPVAAALAAASSIPVGSMGKWFDSLMKKFEDVVRGQKMVTNSIYVGTFVAVKDLDDIRVLVDGLEIRIGYLLRIAELTSQDEEAVEVGVEEIRKKLGDLMKSIEDLREQADRCSRHVSEARTVVLQRIIRYPEKN